MKHIPLMKRGLSSTSGVSSFGRQLLVDDDDYYDENDVVNFSNANDHLQANEEADGEGTECVIDSRSSNKKDVDNDLAIHKFIAEKQRHDDEYHPPMCGQLFISKVIGQHGGNAINGKQKTKAKELKSQRRSYNRRSPNVRLSKNEKKNQLATKRTMTKGTGGEYHESFSAEQSPDSDSETSSVQSYNDRIRILSATTTTPADPTTSPEVSDRHSNRHQNNNNSSSNRSSGGDSDTTSSLPSHIVQFDPNELELIKTEKIAVHQSANDSTLPASTKRPTPPNIDVARKDQFGADSKQSTKREVKSSLKLLAKVKEGSVQHGNNTTPVTHSTTSFWSQPKTTALATVTEEKSFDLIESPSTASVLSNNNLAKNISVSKMQESTNLLPTASSTSSSDDEEEDEDVSGFFGCNVSEHRNRANPVDSADADDDEIRDDRETMAITQFGCFTPTSNAVEAAFFSYDSETSPDCNTGNDKEEQPLDANDVKRSESTQTDSPAMIEILNAMRQIILKQQDAIQAMSDENVEFRNQLANCHREMKTIQTESADQLVQITQLVIQKNSLDVETTQLKDEVALLRDEILRLKSDDADLVNRFESLMNNNDDATDDDTTVEKTDTMYTVKFEDNSHAFNQKQYNNRNVSPLKDNMDHGSDNESWRQMLGPYDGATNTKKGQPKGINAISFAKTSITEDTVDSTIIDVNTSSSSNSANVTVETILPVKEFLSNAEVGTCPARTIIIPDRHASKDKDVSEFKNRLGEIQKKRMMRMGPNAKSSNIVDTNSKDRKTLSVRFL